MKWNNPIRSRWCAVTVATAAIAALSPSAGGAPTNTEKPVSTAVTTVPAGQNLRGFGRVALEFETLKTGETTVERMRFHTTGNAKARLLAGKFVGELRHSYGVRAASIPLNGKAIPILTAPGGRAFAVVVRGVDATIYGAESETALKNWFHAVPEAADGATVADRYPEYMKRWAWGTYGIGGFENTHGWMAIGEADPRRASVKDPTEDMQFHKSMGNMHFDNWIDHASFDFSDGLFSANGWRWKLKYANEHEIPYAHRVYVNAGGSNWAERRFPEYIEQPAPFLQSAWLHKNMHSKVQPHFSWYADDIQGYLARKTQQEMRATQGPNNRGWMHPHGELVHDPWYDMHSDYSPTALKHWHNYLKKHGVTVAEATAMFGREANPFQSFEQIPIPEFATFAGLPGRILPLGGEWRFKRDLDKAPNDAAWWKRPAAERYTGIREKWYEPAQSLDGWKTLQMPGDEKIYTVLANGNDSTSSWFRRDFSYRPEPAKKKPVYLYFFPISNSGVHAGEKAQYHAVYLNGRKVGEIGTWGALEVTGALKNGNNTLAIQLFGTIWNGRIFLSTDTPKVYPGLGPERNRLFELWESWRKDAKYDSWVKILNAMRQVDPEKPVKFMAPQGFGSPTWLRLASEYGGWPHFTGEGRWFYPWYKRYGKLYGIPGTSELAGPAHTPEEQAEGYRRVFLAGLDGHEPVFMTQTYSRHPEIRKWWLAHKQVFERMGKYDIDGPQVLLYRATDNSGGMMNPYPALGQSTRPVQSVWNWDIGRGALQTLGQSYLYMDNNGVADGKMYDYPLVFDCGNETISADVLADLKKYVESGGVFVALPFTGRNLKTQLDAWPITQLSDCGIEKIRPLGGKVSFGKNQKMFKVLAGKTVDDNGRSMDWQGNNLNTYSVELKPGKDCTVLATYENGKPAIVERKLGKGRVIVLGTAFWRDTQDKNGLWWPGERETAFLADLLNGVGFPPALCRTDDRLIWPQPYRMNNGLDFVSVLVNWHETGVQNPTVSLRLPVRPSRISLCDVKGVRDVPFTWSNGVATVKIEMAAREVAILSADVYSPKSAVSHWWSRQQELWRELTPATGDFSRFDTGKWADPTLDLTGPGARFSNTAPAGDWTAEKFDDSQWAPSPLDVLTIWGAKKNSPLWIRKTFSVDPAWLRGGKMLLIATAWSGPQYLTPTRLILNGEELHGFNTRGDIFDVTGMLKPTGNVIAFESKDGARHVGISGSVFLYHRDAPVESLSLAGPWVGENGTLQLPGKGRVRHPERIVRIPKSWQGKYQVRFYVEGHNYSILGVWVNGKLIRRHHHHIGKFCDIDITKYLKFGEDNQLILAFGTEANGWVEKETPTFDIQKIRLDLFPAR